MTPTFVFGSNLAGRHGKGAAKEALDNWGAVYGEGIGLFGDSYAIPTKGHRLETLPIAHIKTYVNRFIDTAKTHANRYFLVTPIGCGLAGYRHEDIAPLFLSAVKLSNVGLCSRWRELLNLCGTNE